MTDITKQLAEALENLMGFGINGTMESQMAQDDAKSALALYRASLTTPSFGPLAAGDDVERVAKAIYEGRYASEGGVWDYVETKDVWHGYARAAIAALPQAAVKARMAVVDERALEAGAQALHARYEAATHWVRTLKNDPRPFEASGIKEVHRADAHAAIAAYLAAVGGG